MIADTLSNEEFQQSVTELFTRSRKLNSSLVLFFILLYQKILN